VSFTRTDLPVTCGDGGDDGGRFVPETLVAPLNELEVGFQKSRKDLTFRPQLGGLRERFGVPRREHAMRAVQAVGGSQNRFHHSAALVEDIKD
jgi:tryptophan synthase beta subunit